MSNTIVGQSELGEFGDLPVDDLPFTKAAALERTQSIVATGARDGTLATVAGTLLLWRAARSLRSNTHNTATLAATGISVLAIGLRQRRRGVTPSSEESHTDDLTMDDWKRSAEDEDAAKADGQDRQTEFDQKRGSPPTEENDAERGVGGDSSGERTDSAFTADAETQGQSQPSLSADVHDPRRDAGREELDLSETALADDTTDEADSSVEPDQSVQTDEAMTSHASDGSSSADDREDGTTESSSDEQSEADTADENDDEERENGTIPEGGMRQDETDPDVDQARDDTDEETASEDEETEDGTSPEGGMRQDETDPDAT